MIILVKWSTRVGDSPLFCGAFLSKKQVGSHFRFLHIPSGQVPAPMREHIGDGGPRTTTVYRLAQGDRLTEMFALEIETSADVTHGVWWAIAGAGWISSRSEGDECHKAGDPLYGGAPLAFTEVEAKRLAAEWGPSYEARALALGPKS